MINSWECNSVYIIGMVTSGGRANLTYGSTHHPSNSGWSIGIETRHKDPHTNQSNAPTPQLVAASDKLTETLKRIQTQHVRL